MLDAGGSVAVGISYDNSTSGLTATNVQAAVDELQDEKYTYADVLSLFHAYGSAPVYACRAWVNFNGSGTVAIRASGNVSSITDYGVGDYGVNFAAPMPDVNYATSAMGNNAGTHEIITRNAAVPPTTMVFRCHSQNTLDYGDSTFVSISFFR